jgi:serine/threonine protein kinase
MRPESFGNYTLLRPLGKGGMAEVFLARAQSLGGFEKLVAIKRLLPPFNADKQITSMLADEARLSVWLNHPNIVQILDFGRVGKTYYIAMEYVEGCDLCDLIRPDGRIPGRPMPLGTALYVMTQVSEALAYAHRRCNPEGERLGIIHRDVSPHNVLISIEGQVKLADFGLARASISVHRSFAGVIRGKFSYMPKEQAHGREIDQRIDLFAAGVTFYEALTGVKPYTSTNLAQQLYQLEQPVPPPSAHVPDIPEEIDDLTMQAICPDPGDRYQSADDLVADLRSAMSQISTFGQEERQLTALVKSAATLGQAPAAPDPLPHMSLADIPITNDNMIGEEVLVLQQTRYPEARSSAGGSRPTRTPQIRAEEEEEFDTSQFSAQRRDAAPVRLAHVGSAPEFGRAEGDDFDAKRTMALEGAGPAPSLPPAKLAGVDSRPRVEVDPALVEPDTDLNEGLPPGYDSPGLMGADDFLPETSSLRGPPIDEQQQIEAALDQVGLEPPPNPLAAVAGSLDAISPALDSPPPYDTLRDPDEAGRLAREALDEARTIQRSPEEALDAFQRALDARERANAARPALTWKHWSAFFAAIIIFFCFGAAVGWLIKPASQGAAITLDDCPKPRDCPPRSCPVCPEVKPCPQPAVAPAQPPPTHVDAGRPDAAPARPDARPDAAPARAPSKVTARKRPRRPRRPPRRPPRRVPDRRVPTGTLEAGQGFLFIQADAKAKAYVDDRQFAAPVPIRLPLKAGIHRVRVVFVETNTSSAVKWINVKAGKTTPVLFSEID